MTSRILATLLLIATPAAALAQPSPQAIAGFNSYVQRLESRLAQQHQSAATFLIPENDSNLRQNDLIIEQLTPAHQSLPGAMLHHWRGTIFVPHATAADFDRLLRNFPAYPQIFSPQVLRTKVTCNLLHPNTNLVIPTEATAGSAVEGPALLSRAYQRCLSQNQNQYQIQMRIRQRHVLTVVLDASYNVSFAQLDPDHRDSISRSALISEIASPGTPSEHALPPNQAHGLLWRMNTYWSYEQRGDGLVIQLESVSLTRSIPFGLRWAVTPLVESIPRNSLEFTLQSVRNALSKQKGN